MLEDFRALQARVQAGLSALSDVALPLGAKSLHDRIQRDLVGKLGEGRFHLVVVGEFNHGKTTFVNTLLGAPVLPTGVTPTTAVIHHVRYASTPEATVVRASGARESIAFEAVRTFAVGGASEKASSGSESGDTASDAVDFLEVGYPSSLLEERVLLVDTPGVNDLSLQRADITYSYIPRADAVLFLLDAGQILKESERVFLQEKLLKGSKDKIVFVITKWDLLSADEQAEALAYATEKLSSLVPSPRIFPVSAEQVRDGREDASGFPALLAYLTHFLATERGRILLDNALREGLAFGGLLAKGVDARRRALAMQEDELDRRVKLLEQDLKGHAGTLEERRAAIREEVRAIKVGAHKDLERFVSDVGRQLPSVVESAKGGELRTYLPAFLEDTFRRWAEDESREVASSLETLAERTVVLVREDARETATRVARALGSGDVKRLDVQIDTFHYDVGVVALFTVGLGVMFANVVLGGLLTVAAPVLALILKSKVEDQYRKKALELAPAVLDAAAAQLGPAIDALVDEFAQKLDTWVVTAGDELYREVLEVLHASRTARASAGHDAAAAVREVEGQGLALERAVTRLGDLRAELGRLGGPTNPSADPRPDADGTVSALQA